MQRARPIVPFLVLALALALALVVAACAGPAATVLPGATSATTPAGGSAGSGSSPGPAASDEASAGQPTQAPADTTAPTTSKPTKTPRPSAAGASLDTGTAADCSGSDDNRTFFAGVAAQVDWTVMCAVLPKRWFVSAGSFRLAKGGKLLISYKGPDGATLSLSEGAWCTDASGCVPSGDDLGNAALGPMSGTLIGVNGGGYAVSVGGGQPTSWLLETQGVDQATTVELAAAAVAVGH